MCQQLSDSSLAEPDQGIVVLVIYDCIIVLTYNVSSLSIVVKRWNMRYPSVLNVRHSELRSAVHVVGSYPSPQPTWMARTLWEEGHRGT